MPFTISHAAAALPLGALTRLPLAALMIGSMAPDFAYFVPDIVRYQTHTLPALFWFCLPAGLAVWWFFVLVLERPSIAFLPEAWRIRTRPSDRLSARSVFLASAGILLGAVSHLAWDAFTHANSSVTHALPVLRESVLDGPGRRLPWYFLLQLVSSVFGLVVLAAWAVRIRTRPLIPQDQMVPQLAPQVSTFERSLAVLVIAVSAGLVGFLNATRHGESLVHSSPFYLLVGAMAGAAFGWTLVVLALRLRSRLARVWLEPGAE